MKNNDFEYGSIINAPVSILRNILGVTYTSSEDNQYIIPCEVIPYRNAGKNIEESFKYKVGLKPMIGDNIFYTQDYYTSDLRSMLVHNPDKFQLRLY